MCCNGSAIRRGGQFRSDGHCKSKVCFYLIMAVLYLAIGRLPQRTRHIVVMCFCCFDFIGYVVPIAMTKHLWGNGFRFAPFFGVGVIAAIISRLETDQHSMRLCGGLVLSILLVLCVTVLFFMLLPTPIPGYATRGTVRPDLSGLHPPFPAQSGDLLLAL